MPPKEQDQILIYWNKTAVQYSTKTIHELFEKQVEKNPKKIAVSFGDKKITYNELNKKANKLANYIKKLGVKPETLIALCFERSIEIIICILGILKANAAYTPIDPNYPKTRIKDILEDSSSPILLTTKLTYTRLQLDEIKGGITNVVFLDDDWQKIEREDANNVPGSIKPDNLAYVIYTSGSTGKPKGILLTHRTITNLIEWQTSNDHFGPQQDIAQFASFGFDVSLQETFHALLNGHKLHIISSEVKKSISKLLGFLQEKKINKLFLPPSVLGLLAHEVIHYNILLPYLNEIIVASEALIINDEIRQFFNNNKHARLINHYGPSEAHVVTAYALPAETRKWYPLPPIGKPIANTKVYILNKNLQPVPINVAGELYLGGDGLARCYLNRSDLNEIKFITNPFSKNKNEKLYKTGDLVRWLPDGNIAFIDRIDNQVKIRGFRVEIDEIEHCLLQHELIHQCAIKAETDQYGTKRLIAYVVHKDKSKSDINCLKQYLKEKLPEYMVPSFFVVLDQLPLNNNGKVDTAALPKPTFDSDDSVPICDLPNTIEEKTLARIWAKILKLDFKKITVVDSFFELGGHSLASLQLLTEIKKELAVNLEPYELFNAPTIAELVVIIQKKKIHVNGESQPPPNDCSSHVILLKKGKDNSLPIFLIHPIGGTVFWYKNLSLHLNCDNPIYGIQDPCISTKDKIFNSLEEMASFYLTLIKQVQPVGPYLLGGASFGGTVAVEITRQLKLRGEEVKHIILFDSWAVYPDGVKKKKAFEKGIRHMHDSLVEKSAARELSDIKSWLNLQWHRAQLLWNYLIPSVSHNITLFKAKDPMTFFKVHNNPSNYWQGYTTAKVNTYSIQRIFQVVFYKNFVISM